MNEPDLPESTFEERERELLARKVEAIDALAPMRAARQRKYYASQVQRLVGTLVMPGSRVLEVGVGLGDLLASLEGCSARVGIDISPRMIELARERHPGLDLRVADAERDELPKLPEGPFDVIILSEVVGLLHDIQRALERLHEVLAPGGRLVVTYYNFVWEPILKAADMAGLRTPWPEQNWLSMTDIENLLRLTDFEVVRRGTDVLLPAYVPGVSELANRVAAKLPGIQGTALVSFFVARAVPVHMPEKLPGVTVVCPTRNERGNIREAVARTPLMGPATELLFVDGNSTDGTLEEIAAVQAEYEGPLEIRVLTQDGKGKGDAVFKGFDHAKHDVLMILDSDLTTPPEDLPKFYRAIVTGKGEFINGVRLVYPMEGEAMRFLNLVGNKFFSLALSWLLEQPIKDSLCGTKVLSKADWKRISDQRSFFGDFDAFGDFDLLFGAARLNMKITDLPVRYRARVFGETKMNRFAHGFHLLRMTAFGFKKLRMGL